MRVSEAATAHVTGAVAVVLQLVPDLSQAEVRSLLQTTALNLGFPPEQQTDAVEKYFKGYGIPLPEVPILEEEFSNQSVSHDIAWSLLQDLVGLPMEAA